MSIIDGIYKNHKTTWILITQIAGWLLATVGVFILPPPVKNYLDQDIVTRLTAFIVSAIIAVFVIPTKIYSNALDYKKWYLVSIIIFIIFSVSFIFYFQCSNEWTVDNYGVKIIHGNSLVPEAAKMKKNVEIREGRPISDLEFIKYMPNLNTTLWSDDELSKRLAMIRILYILSISLASLFIISISQAIYCYQVKLDSQSNETR